MLRDRRTQLRGLGAPRLLLHGADERGVQHGVGMVDEQEVERAAHRLVDLLQILFVLVRNNDGLHAVAQRCHGLLLQAADGKHAAADGDLARHGDITADRRPAERGGQRRAYGDTGGRTVLRHGTLGKWTWISRVL